MTRLRHGKSNSKVYTVWESMLTRCRNPNNAAYPNYGGRGIGVCPEWELFDNFYRDMGDPPAGATLDRIDNDAGYSPANCQWASRLEQSRNRRTRRLEIGGISKPIWQWAEEVGIKSATIRARLKYGWSPIAAVYTPLVRQRDRHGVRWSDQERDAA